MGLIQRLIKWWNAPDYDGDCEIAGGGWEGIASIRKVDRREGVMDNAIRAKICELLSKMLDNPDKYGIYPTTEFMDKTEEYIISVRDEAKTTVRSWQEQAIAIIEAMDWMTSPEAISLMREIANADLGARNEQDNSGAKD